MTGDLRDELQTSLGVAYTIERELGGGGMSRVFEATETALGRTIVVKLLTPELAAGVSAERFAREVRVAARLQHANIVPLLSAGNAAGLPFYTMPFVRGESLRARAVRGALPIAEAVNILRDVARALSYAHGEGIVHRDIKPENVLLSGGAAMVADFGIAKAVSAARTQDGGGNATLTQAGGSLGTPMYMAPEQASGDPGTDQRADLYAWGVVAYELLAGAHPFAGRSSVHALIAAHMVETPAPLADRRIDVPAALVDIVMRCLEKDPSRRPQTANELLAALDNVTTPTPVANRRPERSHLAARTANTRRVGLLTGSVAVIALIGWLLTRSHDASGRGARIDSTHKSLAVLPFESVGGDTANAYFAEGMADELATALSKVAGLKVAGRSSASAFKGKHAASQDVGRVLGVSAVLEGTVRRDGDRMRVTAQLTNAADGLLLWSETYQREVKDVFAVQDNISRAIVNALRVTLGTDTSAKATVANAGTTNVEAYQLYMRGLYFYQRRGTSVAKAIASFQAAIAKDSAFARAHAALGLSWTTLSIYSNTPTRTTYPRAIAEAARALALDAASAEAYVAAGLAHTYAHHWDQAEDAFRRALALDPNLPIVHLWYSRMLSSMGRVEEAVHEIQQAKGLDPLSAATVATTAFTLSMAGRHAEAMAEGRRGVELDSTQVATQSYLLVALVNGGLASEARRRGERLVSPTTDISVLGVAAYAIGRGGDPARAAALARQIEREHGHESRVHTALVRAWLGAGDTTRALAELERVIELHEVGIVNHPLIDRMYDPVRSSARFAAIVRAVGLDVTLLTTLRR